MQSIPITTIVVSSNPPYGEVYSIQHYVIKFVSDLLQDDGFLWILWFPPPIKTDRHNITDILISGIKNYKQPISVCGTVGLYKFCILIVDLCVVCSDNVLHKFL